MREHVSAEEARLYVNARFWSTYRPGCECLHLRLSEVGGLLCCNACGTPIVLRRLPCF